VRLSNADLSRRTARVRCPVADRQPGRCRHAITISPSVDARRHAPRLTTVISAAAVQSPGHIVATVSVVAGRAERGVAHCSLPVDEVVARNLKVGDVVRLDDPQSHHVERLVIVEDGILVEQKRSVSMSRCAAGHAVDGCSRRSSRDHRRLTTTCRLADPLAPVAVQKAADHVRGPRRAMALTSGVACCDARRDPRYRA
jgi:hypothetical protein